MKQHPKKFHSMLKIALLTFVSVFSLQAISQPLKALNMGLTAPQSKETLPKSKVPIKMPVRLPKLKATGTMTESAAGVYTLNNGWEMLEAYKFTATGESLFNPGLNTTEWYNATVPGTVLTTLVDQGVYPDPYFGINNLAIPDTLCRIEWLYRLMFDVPSNHQYEKSWIVFNGINYAAEIWLNNKLLGTINGAFEQKKFEVTNFIRADKSNILAVRIKPPPNPGFPHEKSQSAGPGRNGGALDLDGPTFISSLGWDWMPGIRDRNIGIWQDVQLKFSGAVTMGYPQVITDLLLPDTTTATITVKTEVTNHTNETQRVTVSGRMENIKFEQLVDLKAGETRLVIFSPDKFSQLTLNNPKLWWPNGYGNQYLYNLELAVTDNGKQSDHKTLRIGIRELTYELTVDAPAKPGWRVEYNPILASSSKETLFDNAGRRQVYPSPPTSVPEPQRVWIPKLKTNNQTAAFREIADTSLSPFMILNINGKRIYCKGGNWGMDDAMKKRISRENLEPSFRLHRDANFNMIRNWTGECTEEAFYDLADEYGLLVWNDFWLSKDFLDIDVFNTGLFLDNARNVVQRFRNHASIAIWCARNEGFPLKILSEGCAQIVLEEDGTRHYTPSSRHLNLSRSGPWLYYPNPVTYAKDVHGFNTEIGIPSVPTGETMRGMMAEEDLWPISDVWAYHDFHYSGPWNRNAYRNAIDSQYGVAKNVDDFCTKAQLVNYESHRAMFEAWNTRLWNNATGVMLWMSQPAWPSTTWQIFSWDYETLGSYYGTRKACEPVHIQLNLSKRRVEAINTTLVPVLNSKINIRIYDPAANLLFKSSAKIDVKENQLSDANLSLPELTVPCYLVILELFNSNGVLVSENRYWMSDAKPKREFLVFNDLPQVKLDGKVIKEKIKEGNRTFVQLKNPSKGMAVSIKLNLRDGVTDKRILPVYFADGYFTLLPGETKKIPLEYPVNITGRSVKVTVEAYNVKMQPIGQAFTIN